MKKVSILIPCFNEEKGIGKVINDIPVKRLKRIGYKVEVIVIDNNSTDQTAAIALAKGATVIFEKRLGKGNAIRKGFASISSDTKYVVMLDGDNTYKPKEMLRLLEPLSSKFCDVVVGSRLGGKLHRHSLTYQNRLVNWLFTFLVRQFYQANVTDVLSGYFAWRKEAVDKLRKYLESDGFAIEMEMITKCERLGFDVYSVPITYDQREGMSKINSIKDGLKILKMLFKNLRWNPNKQIKRLNMVAATKTVI